MRFYALAQRPWIADEDGGGYWGLPPGTLGSVDLSATGARNRVLVTSDQPFTVGGDILAAFGDGTRLDQLALSGRARNNWNDLLAVSIPNGTVLLEALWDILTIHADPDGLTRAKPIIPTRRGMLELHLGGHSLVRSEKLPEDPTLHPAWGAIQRVLRNNYRSHYERDETVARKWLGAQQIKLRLSEERVSELLIDGDLERVAPIRPTTTITDNFNRADQSDLGTSAEGWSWTTVTGSTSIVDEEARITGSSAARAEIDLSSDDQHVSAARMSSSGNFGRTATAARFHPSQDTCYCAGKLNDNGDFVQAVRVESGSLTTLGNTTLTWANGDRFGCHVDGSNISITHNGAIVETYTDTAITGHVRTGFSRLGSGGANVNHDNLEATDLLAGADDLVRVVAEAVAAVEQRARLMAVTRQRSDEVGVGHASLRPRSLSRLLGEALGIGGATVSVVEAIGAELVRVVSEAVAATEAMARALGLTRRRHEGVGTAEAAVRLRALARRHSEMTALAETVRSAREMVRLRSEAATISETTVTVIDAIIAAVVRVVSEVIAMAEMAGRPRHRARSRGEMVGLATAVVQVGGVLGAAPAAIADRARMVVRAARRLIDRAAIRFNVPPARR